jgi:AraC-like DNA-binding protein
VLLLMVHFQSYVALAWEHCLTNNASPNRPLYRRWVRLLLRFLLILAIAQWLRWLFRHNDYFDLIVPSTISCGFFWLTWAGLGQSRLLDFAGAGNEKYRQSGLSSDRYPHMARQLEALLTQHRPYRDPDLTLPKLAELLGWPPNQLSQLLNDHFRQNFHEFIRAYRIAAAKELLHGGQARQYTVEALAREAGFSSRASFYRSFKACTGMTPGAYVNSTRCTQ